MRRHWRIETRYDRRGRPSYYLHTPTGLYEIKIIAGDDEVGKEMEQLDAVLTQISAPQPTSTE